MSPNSPIGKRQMDMVALLHGHNWMKGPEIADALGIQLSEVWNIVNRVRMRGINIMADRRGPECRGYRLDPGQNVNAFLPVPDEYAEEFVRLTTGADRFSDHEARRIINDHVATMARRAERSAA